MKTGSPARRLRAGLDVLRLGLLELLFPTRCVGCGRTGSVWCGPCRQGLRPAPGELCLVCRRLVVRDRRHRCRPPLARARAAACYRPPLDRALTSLKYHPDPRLVRMLARLLEDTCRRAGWQASCVIPVPLGGERLRQRGYNQAELLGRALAGPLRLPVAPAALRRIRETASQVGLDPAERWRNVEGAFLADPPQVDGQFVLLVDDVCTTGSTLAACSAALVDAGAAAVRGLTVGRA